MKTRLAKFYRSLACRVALAIVATASVAKAHDLPYHFPLAPTDWGMIQQDCMGHSEAQQYSLPSSNSIQPQWLELAVTLPDAGSPPIPTQHVSNISIASGALVSSDLYDGVDCAQLESFYRTPLAAELAAELATELAAELVEHAPSDIVSPAAEATSIIVAAQPELNAASWQFHKSFFAACSCDFESQQADQLTSTPLFVFHSVRIADYFVIDAGRSQSFVLRDPIFDRNRVQSSEQAVAPNWVSPLAVAVPTVQLQNKQRLAAGLAELATWDCMLQNELFQFSGASRAGKLTGDVAKGWYGSVLPNASSAIVELANSLKPASPLFEKRELAQQFGLAAPMFIIYQTAAGNEVAIPIAQARQFTVTQPASISPEFKQLVDTANARLQWAGGRLSEAAGYINGWFSERIARARNNDLR